MSLTRTNIYLDEKQLERLRAKGERDKLPVSEIVRRAIDAYLAWDDPTYNPTPITPAPRNGALIGPDHPPDGAARMNDGGFPSPVR